METALRSVSSGATSLFAEVVVRMIRTGEMEQLFAEKREEAKRRQAMATEVFKGLKTKAHPTSFHVWIELPKNIPSGELAARLAAEEAVVSASKGAAVGDAEVNGIRVALGAVRDLNELKTGLLRVRAAIDRPAGL